jgi:hypothetical protein
MAVEGQEVFPDTSTIKKFGGGEIKTRRRRFVETCFVKGFLP